MFYQPNTHSRWKTNRAVALAEDEEVQQNYRFFSSTGEVQPNFLKPPSGTFYFLSSSSGDNFLFYASKSHNRFNVTVHGDCLQSVSCYSSFSSSCGDSTSITCSPMLHCKSPRETGSEMMVFSAVPVQLFPWCSSFTSCRVEFPRDIIIRQSAIHSARQKNHLREAIQQRKKRDEKARLSFRNYYEKLTVN